uniref:Sprouty related EVH1 domain containing 3 n=1 Tax=Gopherus evgoodei TaxID=1825980 RepID=A0A8C5EYD2_9SAUR
MLRVRAVVMTRDDSSGGWVPMGGGGLSHVMIGKVRRPEEGGRRRQYLICGERLRDQTTILECVLKKDLVYNKVNPIFHHWKVGDSKFGLTFQSPADAAAFERSVQAALEELAEGGSLLPILPPGWGLLHSPLWHAAPLRSMLLGPVVSFSSDHSGVQPHSCHPPSASTSDFKCPSAASLHPSLPVLPAHRPSAVPEFTPFTLHPLPAGPLGIVRPSLTAPKPRLASAAWNTVSAATGLPGGEGRLRDPKGSPSCRIHAAPSPPKQKHAKEPGASGGAGSEEDAVPSRCVYCRDVFNHEENGRGQCQDAPDPIGRCVYQLTCMWCAESMLYHCMSDSEGEYSDPCSCDPGHPHFCVRWMALVALSLVVPCMCCYLPLRACHWCGEHCGCCGGKHKAVR